MRLVVTEFLSLDGVAQGPGSPDEDRDGGFTQGGWLVPHMDEAFLSVAAGWIAGADAFLFGRRTYENFARDWPKVTDPDDPFAAKLNGLPKFVASRTLTTAPWEPSTILAGDLATEVAELKSRPGREIQVHGSATLAQSLLAAGLVDEFRLVVAPVVLGQGRRLFPPGGAPAGLRVVRNETTPGGLVIQVFESAGAPRYGTYGA
ncbi:dihydrofolate reductase family protein [Phytohabitans houttuyneae]|uniref:Deaminase reductase n=1 Tax=Phytohabitans houttuyneae TaxID=1076126 RepID=A0A6V8KFX8_9ACTN|nr:dihydrofolate reductase family protein [Phytohabitans houttuyneae]GFJ84132.1 deaminase reductase [Phytohabitans houttuyneae]